MTIAIVFARFDWKREGSDTKAVGACGTSVKLVDGMSFVGMAMEEFWKMLLNGKELAPSGQLEGYDVEVLKMVTVIVLVKTATSTSSAVASTTAATAGLSSPSTAHDATIDGEKDKKSIRNVISSKLGFG